MNGLLAKRESGIGTKPLAMLARSAKLNAIAKKDRTLV